MAELGNNAARGPNPKHVIRRVQAYVLPFDSFTFRGELTECTNTDGTTTLLLTSTRGLGPRRKNGQCKQNRVGCTDPILHLSTGHGAMMSIHGERERLK